MSAGADRSAQGTSALLLFFLSATAGATDAIGYLALDGLFTAHITGNIVILASQVVTRGNAGVAPLISVPVFMLVLGLARLLGLSLARPKGNAALDVLLLLQIVLLLAFFLLAFFLLAFFLLAFFLLAFFLLGSQLGPAFDANALLPVLAGMFGVAAMAVQNALVQTELPGAPSTAVLTTTVTRFAIAVMDAIAASPTERGTARGKLAVLLPPILGFIAGCLAGAVLAWRIGLPALMLPTFLATVAALLAACATPGRIRDGSTAGAKP